MALADVPRFPLGPGMSVYFPPLYINPTVAVPAVFVYTPTTPVLLYWILLAPVVPALPFGSSSVVNFLPLRIYPCATPPLSTYPPTDIPALLIPPGLVDMAPGTL